MADSINPKKRSLMPSSPLRRSLRAAGHHLSPVVQVGKEGVTEAVLAQVDQALFDHELIKVKSGTETPEDRFATAEAIAAGAEGSQLAQILGRTLLLYRRHPDKPRFEPLPAPPKAARPDRKSRPAGTTRPERGGRPELRSRPERTARPERTGRTDAPAAPSAPAAQNEPVAPNAPAAPSAPAGPTAPAAQSGPATPAAPVAPAAPPAGLPPAAGSPHPRSSLGRRSSASPREAPEEGAAEA